MNNGKKTAALIVICAMICLVIIAYFVPMPANSQPICTTVDEVKSDILKFKAKPSITEMGSGETRAFLSGFNAYPPETKFSGDYAVVLFDDKKPNMAVVLFERGCFVHVLFVGKDKFKTIMESI
jgi:hypothetical protein